MVNSIKIQLLEKNSITNEKLEIQLKDLLFVAVMKLIEGENTIIGHDPQTMSPILQYRHNQPLCICVRILIE